LTEREVVADEMADMSLNEKVRYNISHILLKMKHLRQPETL